jgi:hypothetical protein
MSVEQLLASAAGAVCSAVAMGMMRTGLIVVLAGGLITWLPAATSSWWPVGNTSSRLQWNADLLTTQVHWRTDHALPSTLCACCAILVTVDEERISYTVFVVVAGV